jgi:hypothetical protein
LRGAKEAGQMLAAQSDEKMKTKDSKDLNNYNKRHDDLHKETRKMKKNIKIFLMEKFS